jgi:hypothetical protein
MKLQKDYQIEIKNAIKGIFDIDEPNVEINGLMITIREPLVKQQIILLAKLCQKIPLSTSLRASRGKTIIEFW